MSYKFPKLSMSAADEIFENLSKDGLAAFYEALEADGVSLSQALDYADNIDSFSSGSDPLTEAQYEDWMAWCESVGLEGWE